MTEQSKLGFLSTKSMQPILKSDETALLDKDVDSIRQLQRESLLKEREPDGIEGGRTRWWVESRLSMNHFVQLMFR